MSTIIRDAIIRLKLEQAKTKLESPDVSAVKRAYEAEEKAAREAARATQEATAATKEHAAAVKESSDGGQRSVLELERRVTTSNYQMMASFREGGEGALRMARGLAFLSASGSDSLQQLMQKVALAQGAFDVFAGGFKLFSNLGAVFGPVGVAVAGITAVVAAGTLAWREYKNEVAETNRQLEESRKRLAAAAVAESERQAKLRSGRSDIELDVLQRRIGSAGTPQSRQRRLEEAGRRLGQIVSDREAGVEDFVSRFSTAPAQLGVRRELESRERGLLRAVEDRERVERQLFEADRDRLNQQSASATQALISGVSIGGPAIPAATLAGGAVLGAIQRNLEERTKEFEREGDRLIEIFRRTNERLLELQNAADQRG